MGLHLARRTAVTLCGVLIGIAIGSLSRRTSRSIETNQSVIADSYIVIDPDDSAAVFKHVFSALPVRAVVYPSGGHYYFNFSCNHGRVQGNLWLTPELLSAREIRITYSLGVPGRDKTISVRLGRRQGLYLLHVSRDSWLCYYGGRMVVFTINPPAAGPPKRLLPGESWAAPVFDESGLQFHLIFQDRPAHLFWILNQDQPVAEEFDRIAPSVAIGRRSRFAFYIDQANRRWILVGVDRRNSLENTWYDGPFDQLPGAAGGGRFALRKYLEAVYPDVRGQIDDFGRFKLMPQDDVAVMPWMLYDKSEDLAFIKRCEETFRGAAFYSCITPDRFAGAARGRDR